MNQFTTFGSPLVGVPRRVQVNCRSDVVINCSHPHKFFFWSGVTYSPLTINLPIPPNQTQQENLGNSRQLTALNYLCNIRTDSSGLCLPESRHRHISNGGLKKVTLCSFWEVLLTQIFAYVLLWHVCMSTYTWACKHVWVCVCAPMLMCSCLCGSLRLMPGGFINCSQPIHWGKASQLKQEIIDTAYLASQLALSPPSLWNCRLTFKSFWHLSEFLDLN